MPTLNSFACCLLLATIAGCSSNSVENQVAALNDSNIKRAANLYAACQSANGGQGPKDIATIKAFVQGMPEDALQMMKIDKNNLDAIFVSDRDGKPFKIKFGAIRYLQGPHVPVVFEQAGRGGTKQVAWTSAYVEEVNDAKYQELWGEKPEAPTTGPPPGSAGAAAAKAK